MENSNFSPNEVVKQKFKDSQTNLKNGRNRKTSKKQSKYIVKVVDGVKHMVLNPKYGK